ncbi:MAG: hypothetical protein ACK5PS_13345 [Desulfopila sp.]
MRSKAEHKVEQVLQKIHFIERDIELHRNILMSVADDDRKEMERVIGEIARMKGRVEELKGSIAELDPEVHGQVLQLEEGTRKFQQLARERAFQMVFTLDQLGECVINLVDGSQVECLVKAVDERGAWVGLTHHGEVVEFSAKEVMEL